MIEVLFDSKLFIAFLGWVFGFYLSNRSNRRTEISRLKDRLVDKIEKVSAWYVGEIIEDDCNKMLVEQVFVNKISQCETRMLQFNKYVGCNIFQVEWMGELRKIDFEKFSEDPTVFLVDVHDKFSRVMDEIEGAYDAHYIQTNFLNSMWKTHGNSMLGAIGALSIICLFLMVMRQLFM